MRVGITVGGEHDHGAMAGRGESSQGAAGEDRLVVGVGVEEHDRHARYFKLMM